ncbi:MAG TPA: 16S rRNA (cytosine(1402)-N(4))-methyltransferase RsmH [Gammaproteobacteria bacterium]|nr:16S rRNA (cytosine(1402)-N(4))-methyltransferase RsmH [Gammaproteobacteria bacterium]
MAVSGVHRTVLLQEAVELLAIRPEGVYVDGTFGRGGHSRAILAQLGSGGRLIAIDRDPEAVMAARVQFGEEARFSVYRGAFSMLERIAREANVAGQVNGVLLDIGVSSTQLDDPHRGFSFNQDGPLDMRMNPDAGETASQWLAHAPEQEIADVIYKYGEERFSRRIARAIVAERAEQPILTTQRLAEIASAAVPTRERNKHPATRTFQAIRIFINRELEELDECLGQCLRVLAPGGRLAVISFHSLEDRIVKRFIRDHAREAPPDPAAPWHPAAVKPVLRQIGKAVRSQASEIEENPRARSAVLRTAEKLA